MAASRKEKELIVMKFYRDKNKELERIFEKVRKKYFKNTLLPLAKIVYIFWKGEKKLSDGRVVRGEARIPTPRERDIYSVDFIISVCWDYWYEAELIEKIRLARHELDHCIVVPEDPDATKSEPKLDKEGRLKVKIKKHDINLNIFLEDVEIFGLGREEFQQVESLYKIAYEKAKKFGQKLKKKKKIKVKIKK